MGTSIRRNSSAMEHKDHPHACGDKAVVSGIIGISRGSSPRVWGQVSAASFVVVVARIIPTRVGTRCRKSDINALSKDHPHACGDKKVFVLLYIALQGSSPRVWGQAILNISNDKTEGIIPTRVGTRRK